MTHAFGCSEGLCDCAHGRESAIPAPQWSSLLSHLRVMPDSFLNQAGPSIKIVANQHHTGYIQHTPTVDRTLSRKRAVLTVPVQLKGIFRV